MTTLKKISLVALLLPVAALADVPVAVPELDPSGLGTAVTVVLGLGLIIRGKRRNK